MAASVRERKPLPARSNCPHGEPGSTRAGGAAPRIGVRAVELDARAAAGSAAQPQAARLRGSGVPVTARRRLATSCRRLIPARLAHRRAEFFIRTRTLRRTCQQTRHREAMRTASSQSAMHRATSRPSHPDCQEIAACAGSAASAAMRTAMACSKPANRDPGCRRALGPCRHQPARRHGARTFRGRARPGQFLPEIGHSRGRRAGRWARRRRGRDAADPARPATGSARRGS